MIRFARALVLATAFASSAHAAVVMPYATCAGRPCEAIPTVSLNADGTLNSGAGGGGGGGGTSGGTATASPPSYTEGQTGAALSLDRNGNLRTVVSGGTATPTGSAGTPNANVVTVQGITGGTGLPVNGTFWQATQPVSLTALPALTAGSATIGTVNVGATPGLTDAQLRATALPVSGTVTANLGTLNGAATAANQAATNTALGTLALESGGNLAAASSALTTIAARTPTGNTAPMQSSGGNVALAAGEAHAGEVGGRTILVAATVTTPAGTTAYAANQLVANSATAGSVTPLTFATACRVNGGSGMVRRARIKTTDTGFANASVTLYLYRDAPTVSNGDRGTWLTTEANYLGAIPVTLDKHFTDFEKGIGAPSTGSEINFDCASGSTSLSGLLVATASIAAPVGAKTLTAVLEILAN